VKKIIIFVVLAILAAGGAAIWLFPMAMAADFASKQAPEFKFATASGSVWDGKLTEVAYGKQKIGDLTVKADLVSAVTGKASGQLGLIRKGFTGTTDIIWPIGGKDVTLNNLKVGGDVVNVPGMPGNIAMSGGKFRLQLKNLVFANNICQTAAGEVWTDALAKLSERGWVGPELRGPVRCSEGKIHVEAAGKAPTGEDVLAFLTISPRLDMELTASVMNVQGGAIKALTDMGFKLEGTSMVIRQSLGS
jgi:Type II secretion system (T2SS), protein N